MPPHSAWPFMVHPALYSARFYAKLGIKFYKPEKAMIFNNNTELILGIQLCDCTRPYISIRDNWHLMLINSKYEYLLVYQSINGRRKVKTKTFKTACVRDAHNLVLFEMHTYIMQLMLQKFTSSSTRKGVEFL